MKFQKAFTLIELLVVISIIGLLASIVLVSLEGAKDRAYLGKSFAFAGQVHHALGAYAVAVYDFNDGTAKDLSGYGNTGTVNGVVPTTSLPELGKSLWFDGSSSYVEASSSPSLNPTNEITVESWFKHEYDSWAWMAIVGKNSYVSSYLLWVEPSTSPNGISGLIYVAGARYNVFSNIIPVKGSWYHAVYTVKQGEMNIYIDGEWKAKTVIPVGSFNTNANSLRISGQGGSLFKGFIDDVRIYNQALSSAQIQQIYAEEAPKHEIALNK